jgi:hypothetical protein
MFDTRIVFLSTGEPSMELRNGRFRVKLRAHEGSLCELLRLARGLVASRGDYEVLVTGKSEAES